MYFVRRIRHGVSLLFFPGDDTMTPSHRVNKTPRTSRTFRRILAEYKKVVLCNSTILVSIPVSLNYYFNLFGVIPNAPTFTGISHILLISLFNS